MTLADGERALARALNRRTILRIFLRGESITRVRMADITGLSRPTVNAIVGELIAEGLVEQAGTLETAGRAATVYRLRAGARSVIGIDLGGAKIMAAVADITGTIRVDRTIDTNAASPGIVDRITQLCRELMREADLEAASLSAVAIGTPGVADPVTGRIRFAANIPELAEIDLRRELEVSLGVPVALDNDVNMAVRGERWRGLAQGSQDVVFIAAGKGLGMGIIAGGQLQRGSRGAAGEVGFLPLAGDPFDGMAREFGPMEELVSASGIVRAYEDMKSATDPALGDSRAVIDAARQRQPTAVRAVDTSARWLALIISSVHAVLDPERIIVGGGVGADELMLAYLRRHLAALSRRPPIVERSALDGRAALLGALVVSIDAGQRTIGAQED